MHTDQLNYFLHVAETGSINSAAQKFFITQQAINIQLKKLEDELGTHLLNRTPKGITLTPQGQIFLPFAQKFLQQYDNVCHELQLFNQYESNLSGTLSIFAASVFSDSFLPNVISTFMEFHPNTMIKIIDVNSDELLSYLFHEYCDLVLFSASKNYIDTALKKHKSNDIEILPLLDDSIVLCTRFDHSLGKYKAINQIILEQYAQKESFRYSLYQITPTITPDFSYSNAISTSNNVDLHKKLILEKAAVTFMPYSAYRHKFQKDGFHCIPMENVHPINHCILYRKHPKSDDYSLLHCFLDYLQKQFQRKFGIYQENCGDSTT